MACVFEIVDVRQLKLGNLGLCLNGKRSLCRRDGGLFDDQRGFAAQAETQPVAQVLQARATSLRRHIGDQDFSRSAHLRYPR